MCKEAAEVSNGAAAPSTFARRKTGGTLHGIEFWSDAERLEIESLARRHGEHRVREAGDKARMARIDGKAFISTITPLLATEVRNEAAQQAEAARKATLAVLEAEAIASIRAQPEKLAEGQRFLDAVRKRRKANSSSSI